jgi:hypothetical protein
MSKMKYGEDDFLAEGLEYIKKTYGEHYANPEAQGFQLFDMWDSQGSLLTTARDTAQKYLSRFGKKEGFNKKDLLKALHYIVLMHYAARNEMKPTKKAIDLSGLTAVAQCDGRVELPADSEPAVRLFGDSYKG